MAYGELDKIETLVGKTLTAVRIDRERDAIEFVASEGTLRLYHSQDCCESVAIDDVSGDVDDLIGSTILVAEERTGEPPQHVIEQRAKEKSESEYYYGPDSETWTFYTLRTNKGTVDIRWHGESNGYYSESVDADWTPAPKEQDPEFAEYLRLKEKFEGGQ